MVNNTTTSESEDNAVLCYRLNVVVNKDLFFSFCSVITFLLIGARGADPRGPLRYPWVSMGSKDVLLGRAESCMAT